VHLFALACKELDPKVVFKCADLFRDGWLSHVLHLGCPGERTLLYHTAEGDQVLE
jgi:hypothetical protein